jgi:hypothetical protein
MPALMNHRPFSQEKYEQYAVDPGHGHEDDFGKVVVRSQLTKTRHHCFTLLVY